jgi:hypothetical protein
MKHLLILAVHLLATIAKLVCPGGVRAVVAESCPDGVLRSCVSISGGGVAMKNQWPEQSTTFAAFGRRRVRPCVCVIDRKQHIRSFLCDVLDELGFITSQCAELSELDKCVHPQRPDLIVLGLSADGEKAAGMLKRLAAEEFGGKVLLLAPRASPVLAAVQEFGEKLGLAMLPILHTPFGSVNLCNSVATLLPIEAPPLAPVDIAEAISAGWLELWYQPKIVER